jgi:RecA-family ATPase
LKKQWNWDSSNLQIKDKVNNMELEIEGKYIILRNKVVSKLDLFVIDFIKILEKYTDYVIVSGYVSILFGRSRGTEDIDIFIEKIDFKKFKLTNLQSELPYRILLFQISRSNLLKTE